MLDLDGVATGWVPAFYPWLCRTRDLTETEWRIWHHYRNHGMTDAEFVAALTQYAEEGGFGEQLPVPGISEMVTALVDAGHTVHVVTDRPVPAHADTAWWCDTFIPDYTSLTFSRDKTVFKELGDPTYYAIDDRTENVQSMREAGIFAYLLDSPWNEDADLPRVHSLDEYLDKVLRKANS
jgi:hypothetical protein